MMKKLLFLLISVIASCLLQAQRYSINWQESNTLDYGIKTIEYPFFTNNGYQPEANSVYIYQKINAEQWKNLTVKNLVWEKISAKELYDLDENLLPDFDQFDVLPGTEEGQVVVRVSTLKKEQNSIYRLSSFEVATKSVTQKTTASKASSLTSKVGTEENPLSSGTFYKIKVDTSGVFKITADFLRKNGINPSNITPANFRIYGNGGIMLPEFNGDERYAALQENAIQVVGGEDGVWNDGDYALFYAQGPDGYNLYDRTNGNGYKRTETRTTRCNHLKNIYEDYAYYFINFDKGVGKRIEDATASLPTDLITRFDNYQVIDIEDKNLQKLGRIWTGDAFNTAISKTFKTRYPILNTDEVKYFAQVVGYNAQGTQISYDINGTKNGSGSISVTGEDYVPLRYNGTTTGISGNTVTFNFTPNISSNPNGSFYFDFAEIQYKEDLIYNGTQLNFRDFSIIEGSLDLYGFQVSDATEIEQVWDVSDITNVKRKINQSASNSVFSFGYLADSPYFNNEFVAFKNSAAYTPTFVEKIDNQDLSSLSNIDYLIITQDSFKTQAQRLADYHTTQNSYNVAIVTPEQIYNEFSSGSQDITAIRDFVTRLNTTNGSLKYLFILGDASYDYKNKTTNNDNIVPSYESEESGSYVTSYVTDDYYTMTSTQVSPWLYLNLPNLPVGRLPASNVTQAKLLIDKTLAYYNALPSQSSPFGEWRMKMDFVVDDDNDGGQIFHDVINSALVTNFETSTDKPEYNIRKLYLDAFPAEITAGGQRFPQVNQAISSDVGNSLYMFYFGHGGINGWAQERVLTTTEIDAFNNFNSLYSKFPLVSTITCEFTLWDNPDVYSAGEQFIKHSEGGAANMVTSSRAIGVSYGFIFSKIFMNQLFKLYDDDFISIGDAHLLAKKQRGYDSNHLKVNFLGDPAMKLSRPKKLMVIDNIETPVSGQMRALDFVTISGHINKEDGSLDSSFNGRVAINVFDKRLTKTTLNNDGGLKPVLTFTEEGSPIVKASGKVANGNFTVEFYVPKDINYEIGTGRLLGYADNFSSAGSSAYDVFTNQAQTVGDINPDGLNDSTPPTIQLYMNNTNFADGGITDQNPTLLACVTDDTGINSTGAGIGHDITVILDGEVVNTIVVNDYFSSGESNGCVNVSLKDYQKGSVAYPFRNLEPGEHQITFKVWDMNNNSSTATLNFVVEDESAQNLIIKKPLNWPNPFTNKTYVQFEHNCDDILDVNVQIYTITGKLVKTISTSVTAEPFLEGYRTPRTAIEWDGTDDYGATVGKGTYIFKIFAKSNNQDKCKGSATAIEKMVMLK